MAKGDIVEINGFKYSRVEFEGYKYRAVITFIVYGEQRRFDLYTTNENKTSTFDEALRFIKKGHHIEMANWSSKEQDDRASELIQETLDFWDNKAKVKEQLEMDNKPTDDFYTHGSY